MGINTTKRVGIYTCSQNGTPKPRNIVQVKVGKREYQALIDSGAVVSLVKPEVAEGFKVSNDDCSLVDIQGNAIPTYGKVILPVGFFQEEVVRHEFMVIDSMSFQADLLLGIAFLHAYNIKIDRGNGCLYAFEKKIGLMEERKTEGEIYGVRNEITRLRQEVMDIKTLLVQMDTLSRGDPKNVLSLQSITKVPETQTFDWCLSLPCEQPKDTRETLKTKKMETAASNPSERELTIGEKTEKEKVNEIEENALRRVNSKRQENGVYLFEDLIIPPRSEVICEAVLKGTSRVKAQNIVLEQCEDVPQGLLVARVLCRKNNRVPVRLANVTEKELLVQRKMLLATAFEAETENKKKGGKNNFIRTVSLADSNEILKQLDLEKPSSEAAVQLKNLVLEYIDIFRAPNQKLTCTSRVTHRIITEDVPPIVKRPYRVPFHRQEIMRREIQKLLDDGVITESQSPWSFPAILVEKRKHPGEDVQYRLCIDYRLLNNISKTDFFPLPNIQETIDKLSGSSLFSTMDLASGYFQVPLHPEDREKSAFSTPDNHYEFTRMAMGLKNAPATWSRMMSHIFAHLNYKECLIYLDDIIVFSINDISVHLERLRHIFEKMRESNLKFKPTKCHFLQKEINYLGHVIKEGEYTTDLKKTKIIRNYPPPKSVKETRAFLGLCGFYRKFVPNFAKISQPLTSLTKKDTPYRWTQEQQVAFDKLKEALMTPPILKYPDFQK